MVDAPNYSIRIADISDSDAVSALLAASYSILFPAHYSSETLRSALPHMTKANPKLLASGTYYVAEAKPGNLVGCGGWTAARPGSGEIVEGEAHITSLRDPSGLGEAGRWGESACSLLQRCPASQHTQIDCLFDVGR